MARSDEEVVEILIEIYEAQFAGKSEQRFLISWGDLRGIYGFDKLFTSRFHTLKEAANKKGLCLWDLGEGENGYLIAVVKVKTVDRWRRVPRQIAKAYFLSSNHDTATDDEEDNE